MAKEKEDGKKAEHSKKPKHKLKGIHTHVADDGGFVHEHHYEDDKGHALPLRFGGVSENMEDLHQHMDDHLGPEAAGADEGQGDGDEDAQPGQAGAGAGQEPEPEEE